ncbi:hypothetical protein [Kitasatospora sp. A2-31]|uniref:hypothetical protein n=1 Tax=Kitasatospora sp. A2-31 TaxID=2916414 RepID=UPI001EEC0EF3|nr:hypothetical protein [Kitasatospora sp. A2-31]MCG6494560.1 hypothetical protein [Kitasatospora sp. A2-31]
MLGEAAQELLLGDGSGEGLADDGAQGLARDLGEVAAFDLARTVCEPESASPSQVQQQRLSSTNWHDRNRIGPDNKKAPGR